MEITKSRDRLNARLKRKTRIRKKVAGTALRPRLVVFRSHKHISAQVVDDSAGRTLAAASTLTKEMREFAGKKTEKARKVGEMLAAMCKERGIAKVVFDRNGCLYHGRVKALAEGAREGGLDF